MEVRLLPLIMRTRVRKCRCAISLYLDYYILYLDYYIAPLQPVEAQPAVQPRPTHCHFFLIFYFLPLDGLHLCHLATFRDFASISIPCILKFENFIFRLGCLFVLLQKIRSHHCEP